MEKLVSLVRVGFAEEFFINLLNDRVFVGLSDLELFSVCLIENRCTKSLEVHVVANGSRLVRLTTTVYASAGTTHDFDELYIISTVLNALQQLSSVGSTGCNSNLNFHAAQLVCSKLDAFSAANVVEVELFKRLAFDNFCCGTESSFHNAAGCTEDSACAGTNVDGLVELFVCERLEVDTCHFDHAAEFAGGNSDVNTGNAVNVLTVAGNFKLLRCAGDSGYEYDILGIETHLFCEVSLVHSAEHLLRRLAGGEVFSHFREVVFAVLNPSGRAGSDERELAAVLESAEEFGSFFHDGKVSGEVHVVYAVEAELLESSNHLAFGVGTGFIAEAFTDGSTNGRSAADSNMLGRIGDRVEDLLGVVLFVKSANGTCNNALTAVDTRSFSELSIEERSNLGVETTVHHADRTDTLHLIAGSNAAAAEDTLVGVTNDGNGRVVDFELFLVVAVSKLGFIAVVFLSELLEFAGGGTGAGQTLSFVSREYEFEVGLAYGSDLRSVGLDFHAFVYGIYAGCNETARTGNFNETETASADFVDVLEVAESGDVDIRISAGFKNGNAGRYGIFSTVYFYIYHIHK